MPDDDKLVEDITKKLEKLNSLAQSHMLEGLVIPSANTQKELEAFDALMSETEKLIDSFLNARMRQLTLESYPDEER